MDDILIKDALIVTCDPAHSIIKNGLMTVSDGKITALEILTVAAIVGILVFRRRTTRA